MLWGFGPRWLMFTGDYEPTLVLDTSQMNGPRWEPEQGTFPATGTFDKSWPPWIHGRGRPANAIEFEAQLENRAKTTRPSVLISASTVHEQWIHFAFYMYYMMFHWWPTGFVLSQCCSWPSNLVLASSKIISLTYISIERLIHYRFSLILTGLHAGCWRQLQLCFSTTLQRHSASYPGDAQGDVSLGQGVWMCVSP